MKEERKEMLREGWERTQLIFYRTPKVGRGLEFLLFLIVMWGIAISAFIGIVRRAGLKRPNFLPGYIFSSLDSIPFHYLVIVAAAAATLALFMPALISRVAEVSYGGIKVTLAQSESALNSLESALELPEEPIVEGQLKGPERYHYERLSQNLYRILEQRKDPNTLDFVSRHKYRRLIDYVARAACLMNHQTKFLAIARHLETFKDRKLTWDEQYLIGLAYLVAADELDEPQRPSYWKNAAGYLSAARKKNSYDVTIPFNLGVALLWLGDYPRGIRLMRQCIRMDQTYFNKAKWNIACGLAKLEHDQKALDTLYEIGPEADWEGIKVDPWFATGRKSFERPFKLLCAIKIAEGKVKELAASDNNDAIARELEESIKTFSQNI
jgi:tetratricopeptide (TPR) repeat protein